MSLLRRAHVAPGAPPGTVAIGPRFEEPRLSFLAYDEASLEEDTCEGVLDLPPISRSGRLTWIDVRGLGDGTLVRDLGEHLGLHALAIADVMNVGQRPKVELYGEVLFSVVRMVTLRSDGELQWEQVSVFLGPGFVLTAQETPDDCLEPLRERIRAGRRLIRGSGPDYLACMVLDAIVDGYFPVLETFGDRLESFEDRILEDERTDVLPELYTTKRELAGFRRSTWPLREALAMLMREGEAPLSEMARLHLRDTLDHTLQIVEVCESYRELTASLVDVHLSMVAQRTNEIMRVLTVVSAIFVPMTFVAGVYGMNFDTSQPWNLPELGWEYGYVAFWGVCLFVCATLVLVFRRLGWLRG